LFARFVLLARNWPREEEKKQGSSAPVFSGVANPVSFAAEGTGLEPATPLLGHHISSVTASHSLTLREWLFNASLRHAAWKVKGFRVPIFRNWPAQMDAADDGGSYNRNDCH
jgi:hypothetical protein